MSGPVQPKDRECHNEPLDGVEVREGRRAEVGGRSVIRVLPTKSRRTVGAWCFVDLAGPQDAENPDPMEIGPHPHIGLSTVTWLLEGEALHSDSLGTQQMIRPGQLNLMTAGHGIAHAELAAKPPFRGVQMWLAQPEATRHGASRFAHHAELPRVDFALGEGLLFAGELDGQASPAVTDTPVIGLDLSVRRGTTVLPADRGFEYAIVPLDGRVRIGHEVVEPGWVGLVPAGADELPLETEADAGRLLVLGGEPLGEPVQMWWNFVARDRDELEAAWREWRDRTERFGDVPSPLARIEAPRPPWVGPED